MAEYIKTIAKWKDCPRLLNRTFYFNISANLQDLAFTVLDLFNVDYGHPYSFRDASRTDYVAGTPRKYSDNKGLQDYRIDQISLGPKRTIYLAYDYGENYVFTVKIGNALKKIEGNLICHPIKGKGLGIVEDNSGLLYTYLKGIQINPRDKETFIRDLSKEEMEHRLRHNRDIPVAKKIDFHAYEPEDEEEQFEDINP